MDPKEIEEILMEQQRSIDAAQFLEHAYSDEFSAGVVGQPFHMYQQVSDDVARQCQK